MKFISFNKAKEEYFQYKSIKTKNSTVQTDRRKMELYIFNFFDENKNIYNLNYKDYLDWQVYIEKFNFSYNYKSSLHYCFNDFLNFCMIFYNLQENISKKIGNFKDNEIKDNGNIWSIEEYNQFISVVDNKVLKVLFDLLFFTGVRKGEALALTFEDINYNNSTISINKTITRFYQGNKKIITTPKTRSSNRIISIDNVLLEELKELDSYYNNKSYFIFGGEKSIPFTTLERKKNHYCDLAKVKQIKIHEFRHSHACLLFHNKIEIEDISKRLGHSSISMTMTTYLKYLPTNEKRVISTLNSLRQI